MKFGTKLGVAAASLLLLAGCETASDAVEDVVDGTVSTVEDGINAGVGAITGTYDEFVSNVGDRVFFATNSSVLGAEAQSALTRQAAWLRAQPNVNVIIEGHCDERGTREYNLALGERRANAARNYLVNLGISPSRISTVSYGKERPAVLGSTSSSWAQNRRAVTVLAR